MYVGLRKLALQRRDVPTAFLARVGGNGNKFPNLAAQSIERILRLLGIIQPEHRQMIFPFSSRAPDHLEPNIQLAISSGQSAPRSSSPRRRHTISPSSFDKSAESVLSWKSPSRFASACMIAAAALCAPQECRATRVPTESPGRL